jgi:3D (Asp-Asp-Asp) domain-containing protein
VIARGLHIAILSLLSLPAADARMHRDGRYQATAYSVRGETADGDVTHRRIVAADPDVLPLGSRIHVTNAGAYSGEYEVSDTGRKVQGRKIDIFIPSTAEAKKFGKRSVHVSPETHCAEQIGRIRSR